MNLKLKWQLKPTSENQQVLPNHLLSRRNWIVDICGLILFMSLFYLFYLGHYPLFTPDEGRYAEVAREMVITGDYITPRVNGVAFLDKPVLYYWFQAIAILLFGVKEWALRLFPVLFAMIGCIMTYFSGRILFNRRTGLIASVVLATTPLYFGGAHYANLDLEVAVLISCTLFSFISAMGSTGRQRTVLLFAMYLFSGLAFLTKGMIGIAFPGLIIFTWIAINKRWAIIKNIHLIPGLFLFFAIVTPWYLLVQKENPAFFHYFFVTQQVTRFLSAGEFNNKTPFWFYLPIVIVGFFPWTIFLIQTLYKTVTSAWHDRKKNETQLFFFLWFAIILVFFSIPHSKIVGYILPVFPALSILVGNYLSQTWDYFRRRDVISTLLSFTCLGALIICTLVVLPRYHWIEFAPNFIPYLKTIILIFIASMVVMVSLIKVKKPLPFFATCTVCSVFFLLTLVMGATHLNQNTAKPLIEDLKTIIKPDDEVVTYFKYYQDIPLYLEKRVTIVTDWNAPNINSRDNWVRELWNGRTFQPTEDWLIGEETFWERWNSAKRIFVFVNENYFSQFRNRAKSYFFLGRYNDIILLSNKPNIIEGTIKNQWKVLSKNPELT